MLNNPDMAPLASVNRWIVAILAFHFEIRHVPGKAHGPDGLSCRPPQPGDLSNNEDLDDFEDWVDNMYGFLHLINPTVPVDQTEKVLLSFAYQSTSTLPEGYTESEDMLSIAYSTPHGEAAVLADKCLEMVHDWLRTFLRPDGLSEHELALTICYASNFFIKHNALWKCDPQGAHKRIFYHGQQTRAIEATHNDTGHRGFYATNTLITERYWWPFMGRDIAWYVRTCHICQLRQTRQIAIPPVVATLAPLFVKMYMDTMHLLRSGGFSYIVQGCCSLTHYPEFRMLRKETTQTLGDWIFQDILCQWGTLVKIVSDNSKAFIAALSYLEKKYHVKHIRISGYNLRANGIVERSHFDIRQALVKASDGTKTKWSQVAQSIFWSECVTPCKRMGCSPYFVVTGTHPILFFDIVEANYLLPPPDSLLSTTDLSAR